MADEKVVNHVTTFATKFSEEEYLRRLRELNLSEEEMLAYAAAISKRFSDTFWRWTEDLRRTMPNSARRVELAARGATQAIADKAVLDQVAEYLQRGKIDTSHFKDPNPSQFGGYFARVYVIEWPKKDSADG